MVDLGECEHPFINTWKHGLTKSELWFNMVQHIFSKTRTPSAHPIHPGTMRQVPELRGQRWPGFTFWYWGLVFWLDDEGRVHVLVCMHHRTITDGTEVESPHQPYGWLCMGYWTSRDGSCLDKWTPADTYKVVPPSEMWMLVYVHPNIHVNLFDIINHKPLLCYDVAPQLWLVYNSQ
jgi:hypothetical protein